jgi:hypothetical protein
VRRERMAERATAERRTAIAHEITLASARAGLMPCRSSRTPEDSR